MKNGGQLFVDIIPGIREYLPEEVHQAMQLGAFYKQLFSRAELSSQTHLLAYHRLIERRVSR